MIQKFVDRFMERREDIARVFFKKHPDSYEDIIRTILSNISIEESEDEEPDPERIHTIDDGDYQGTLVFIIGATGYQPSTYWYVKVSYGSCSGCDTLQGIREYDDAPPTEAQVKDYMILSLHIIQELRKMEGERA